MLLTREITLKEKCQHETFGFPCAYYRDESTDLPFFVKHHWHEEFELIHFKSGSFCLAVNMEEYQISEECFCFLNAGELHCIESNTPYQESALVWNPMILNFDALDEPPYYLLEPLMNHSLVFPRFIDASHPLFHFIKHEYSNIELEYNEASTPVPSLSRYKGEQVASRLMVQACLLKILAQLSKEELLETPPKNSNGQIEIIKAILSYMKENYSKPLRIHDFAGIANMNEQYFCRFFKKSLGKPPMKYLNELRIRHAITLLQDTSLSITEICLDCGFNNLGNFLREFKSSTGTTPLQYRKSIHFD